MPFAISCYDKGGIAYLCPLSTCFLQQGGRGVMVRENEREGKEKEVRVETFGRKLSGKLNPFGILTLK